MNVLFDLDGTLTDPGQGFAASIRYAFGKLGIAAPPDAEIVRFIGPPLEEGLAALLGEQRNQLAEAVALYRERYGTIGLLENAVYPGIESCLAALSATGAALFVATSKPQAFAERILQHFGLAGRFRAIHGSQFDGTRSSKAQLIQHLLRTEKLQAESTIMVGDRAQDVAGAAANGVATVGVLWGYGNREELAGAVALCDHPSLLPGMPQFAGG